MASYLMSSEMDTKTDDAVANVRYSARNDEFLSCIRIVPDVSLSQQRMRDDGNDDGGHNSAVSDPSGSCLHPSKPVFSGLSLSKRGKVMATSSEAAERRDNYLSEMECWLACLNRSWIGDDKKIDIEHGGCAAEVCTGAVRRLMGKIAALGVA